MLIYSEGRHQWFLSFRRRSSTSLGGVFLGRGVLAYRRARSPLLATVRAFCFLNKSLNGVWLKQDTSAQAHGLKAFFAHPSIECRHRNSQPFCCSVTRD